MKCDVYSLRKLEDLLHFRSTATLEKYLRYLEESYLLFSVFRFSHSSATHLKSPKKIYTVDNGFIHAKAIQHSLDKGKMMENCVFTELVKRGHKPDMEIFYYKTRNDREIDFALRNGTEVSELIQVCYDMALPEVEKREVKALIEACDETKAKKLTIITRDEKKEILAGDCTIQVIPLWEWGLY